MFKYFAVAMLIVITKAQEIERTLDKRTWAAPASHDLAQEQIECETRMMMLDKEDMYCYHECEEIEEYEACMEDCYQEDYRENEEFCNWWTCLFMDSYTECMDDCYGEGEWAPECCWEKCYYYEQKQLYSECMDTCYGDTWHDDYVNVCDYY